MAWCTRSWSRKPGKSVKSPFMEFELRAGLSCLFTHFLGLQAVADLTSTFFSKKVLLSLVWYQPRDRWKRDIHLRNYLTAIFQHFIFCISIGPEAMSKHGMIPVAGSHINTSISHEIEEIGTNEKAQALFFWMMTMKQDCRSWVNRAKFHSLPWCAVFKMY